MFRLGLGDLYFEFLKSWGCWNESEGDGGGVWGFEEINGWYLRFDYLKGKKCFWVNFWFNWL